MWHHADHPAIWVVLAWDSAAVFRQFHDNALQTHCVQSASFYFQTLHHWWAPWHHMWFHCTAHASVMWPFAIKGLPMPHSRLLAFGSSIHQVCLYQQRPMCGWCLGGKPSGTRVYCPALKFSQSTLDDSGHNWGRTLPTLWAACHQLGPT